MTVALTGQDVTRFAALQEALLSPLEYEHTEDWCLAVLRDAEALFLGDRSAMLVPFEGGRFHYLSESVDPQHLAAFQGRIDHTEPGALRYGDRQLDHALQLRRQKGLEVCTVPSIARLVGKQPEDFDVFYDHVKPAGLTYGALMTIPLRTGEAFLGVSNSRLTESRFDEEAWSGLMQMVLPAFKAGVNMLVRLEANRDRLVSTVDDLVEALAVFDVEGNELCRSKQLRELLAADAQREALVQRMRRVASSFASRRATWGGDPLSGPAATEELQTEAARYVLRASYMGRGLFGLEQAVVISLERLTPSLPSLESLMESYNLTLRQAEVALLMARGLSDREIATRLEISWHTVRGHAEWVLSKLGVHSRKALALALLR